MSQYPPSNGYGQYHGQPPSQQYDYQLPANYVVPPPPLNHAYNSAFVSTASNKVHSSFQFNANQIPGLGIAGGPGLISPSNVPAPGGLIQASSTSDSSVNRKQGTAIVPPPKNRLLSTTYPAMDTDFEEGELNEEQFEDLYEPQEPIEQSSAFRDRQKHISSRNTSGVVSAADTPDAGFYGNEEDGNTEMDGSKNGHNGGRERSGSYSPFLSPRGTPPAAQSAQGPRDLGQHKPTLPGFHVLSHASTNGPAESGKTEPQQTQDTGYAFKSVEEARKEVQKAILRMWPLGIRFQHYVDEGFDEGLIRSLFNQLNLEIKDTPSNQQGKSGTSKPDQAAKDQQTQKSQTALPPPKPQAAVPGDAKTAGEERKDRIARLLAAKKAAKPSVPPVQAQPQTKMPAPKAPEKKDIPFSPPKAPAAMTRSKAWGEKERLLQQKILALQEAQAQKAKAKTDSATAQILGNGPGISVQRSMNNIPTHGPSAFKNAPVSAQLVEKPTNPEAAPSIPGLLLPIPTGPARNQRKRPVAADFVDIPPAVRPGKRPFGQHRKEASFVIDISDTSEGEDMEIDAESLGDVSTSLPGLASQRGPSIRDFPPLSNTPPQRQVSSPVPISNNALGHPILSRKRETELDIKEKEIQEMRRKIAEAEARRKAKQSSGGPLTPTQTAQTPESKDSEQTTSSSDREASVQLASAAVAAQLPKKPDLSQASPKLERRGRIVSLDLPRIEETIEEKRNRLRQLQEEEMRLQAEIDSQLAKKKLLTEELEQLGNASSDDAPQVNGSDATSGVPTPIPVNAQEGNQSTSAAVSIASNQSNVAVDVPMDEDQSSVADEVMIGDTKMASPKATTDVQAVEQELLSATTVDTPVHHEAQGQSSRVVSDHAEPNDSTHGPNPSPPHDASGILGVDQHVETPESDDDPAPMDIESPSPSPAANLTPFSNDVASDEIQPAGTSPSEALLGQVSSVTKPREAVQEIEGQTTRELNAEAEQQSKSGFVPYESPLRYFRAYRFHPSYSETVRGGMKSLTYNNQIDPQQPFCPTELAGEQCPADCEFQHIRSIGIPPDKILLDLGKSSDYSGEQKSRFVQGLRKLLGDIRERGCTDFETIAREIVAFRAEFLGDPSKILPLGGVTI